MPIPYFDAHCDTITRFRPLRRSGCHIDLERLCGYEGAAQIFAIFARPGFDRMSVFSSLYRRFLRETEKNDDLVRHVRSIAEADEAAREGRIAAFLSVEGAGLLDCSVEGLEEGYRRGVRLVTLCWNHDNALCGAALGSGSGLTERGARFVLRCNELGVAVDLSHASERTFWDTLAAAKKPPLCTHSDARALCDHPRNLTDEQITALIGAGGVIGLNLYPEFLGRGRDIAAITEHAEHFLSLGAAKALCLGTDFDGVDCLPEGIGGVEDMEKVYEALLRHGIGEDTVRDIFRNNLRRYLEDVL